jgi:hypothetical protein
VGLLLATSHQIHCADLNKDFLAFCSNELSDVPNAACHLIRYADFSSLQDLQINKAYSTAVWIHFNFYDMVLNLLALNLLLPCGGFLYFDYADPAGIKIGDQPDFNNNILRRVSQNNYPTIVRRANGSGSSFNSTRAMPFAQPPI